MYKCASSDEFDNLKWDSPAVLDDDNHSKICVFGNQFKFFLPGRSDWDGELSFELQYLVAWNDEIDTAFVAQNRQPGYVNTVDFIYRDYTYEPPGWIPKVDPPQITKTLDRYYVDEDGQLCADWIIQVDVEAGMSYDAFSIREALPNVKVGA